MNTEVIMERELLGGSIRQKSKSEYFSATDLANVGNSWRMKNGLTNFNLPVFLSGKGTKEFIQEIERKYDCKAVVKGRGRNSCTWVHPLLFIDIALSVSPTLKLEVYEWIFDHLIKYRNQSGDSYKKMCAAIFERIGCKSNFQKFIIKTAENISEALNVSDWNKANEIQLQQRDKIHESITLLCNVLKDPSQAVKLGIYECTK